MNSLNIPRHVNASAHWIEVSIQAKHQVAEGIAAFELAGVSEEQLPGFAPGAHIDVEVAPGLIRQYSLCGGDDHKGRYLIGVLNDPNSRGGSKALHAKQVGEALRISAPRNHFPLHEGAEHSVLIAGGIGITPILSMAEHLQAIERSFELHFCARSHNRAAFYSRIQSSDLAGKTNFYFDDLGQRLDLPSLLGQSASDSHIYVCGPEGFMTAVLSQASAAGLPEAHLHKEYFVAAATQNDGDNTPFDLIISSTGERLHVGANESIVQVLEKAGIEVPVSCEQGICGTCLTGVLEGEVDHRDSLLSYDERKSNKLITPCCSRAKSELLILDL